MQLPERRKTYGFYSPLWGDLTIDKIKQASDEDIAKWEKDIEFIKAYNMPLFEASMQKYKLILENAKLLWGEKSNEYKYLKKARVFSFDVNYFVYPERRLAELKQEIKIYRKKQADEQRAAEIKAYNEQRKQERMISCAEICMRRNLSPEMVFNLYGLQEALLGADKYLNLAWAMRETRNDWSDGFYRVKDALDKFKIETEQDKDIFEDVSDCLDTDYGTDGRVFRDTFWNYDRLFDLVSDKTLIADLESLED